METGAQLTIQRETVYVISNTCISPGINEFDLALSDPHPTQNVGQLSLKKLNIHVPLNLSDYTTLHARSTLDHLTSQPTR